MDRCCREVGKIHSLIVLWWYRLKYEKLKMFFFVLLQTILISPRTECSLSLEIFIQGILKVTFIYQPTTRKGKHPYVLYLLFLFVKSPLFVLILLPWVHSICSCNVYTEAINPHLISHSIASPWITIFVLAAENRKRFDAKHYNILEYYNLLCRFGTIYEYVCEIKTQEARWVLKSGWVKLSLGRAIWVKEDEVLCNLMLEWIQIPLTFSRS
jgi:hypothetical protein